MAFACAFGVNTVSVPFTFTSFLVSGERIMLTTAVLCVTSMMIGQAEAAQPSPLPEDVAACYQYAIGTWTVQAKVGDTTSEGEWSCRWAPGRHCYFITASGFADPPSQPPEQMASIGGYDPVKKQTIEKIFWANGSHYTICYNAGSPIKDQGIIDGEITGVEDGKEFKAKATVERKGPNEFTWTSANAAGVPVVCVFRKVHKPARPKAKP